MAILIEHTGGKWPFWISPRQAIVCSIAEAHAAYAENVRQILWDAGFYADSDVSDNKLTKKVAVAQAAQYNFILVVGADEVKNGTVNLRLREAPASGGGRGEIKTIEELVAFFKDLELNYR